IYGVERLCTETWDALSAAIGAAHRASPEWHVTVMRRFGHYRRAIQDSYWSPGGDVGCPQFFAPAFRVNALVMCHHPEMTDHNGNSPWRTFGAPQCDRFGDYLDWVDALIAQQRASGVVALKSALAYDRDLAFRPAERDEAARAFGRRPDEVGEGARRAYQDFLFDYLCGLAARYELPFQQHTGMGRIGGSRPMNLEPMLARHPQTRFVLLHGGYPWVGEIAGLAHTYRNVFPDLTWLPLLSPTAAVRAIREWLEAAPSARSICWGGDAWTGEESVGAALALKHVLAIALAQLVEEGYFALEEALVAARYICSENAQRLYGL
ncbi:MAG: amidohydrolase family protein, partial [Armatimonadota bacterium]|nr:amidohydrolase family protein [Armatimonadota bacterium]